jgi:hypothetical protein
MKEEKESERGYCRIFSCESSVGSESIVHRAILKIVFQRTARMDRIQRPSSLSPVGRKRHSLWRMIMIPELSVPTRRRLLATTAAAGAVGSILRAIAPTPGVCSSYVPACVGCASDA